MIIFTAEEGSHVQFTDKPIYNTLVMGDMVQQKTVVVAEKHRTPEEQDVSEEEDYTSSPLYPYVTDKSQAQILLKWLYQEMDTLSRPKDKLRVIKALEEGNYFNSRIPCSVFCSAFGEMTASTYSYWMNPAKQFETSEIDAILSAVSSLFA